MKNSQLIYISIDWFMYDKTFWWKEFTNNLQDEFCLKK